MSTPIILLCVAGAVVFFVSMIVLVAFIQSRRLAKAPPPPAFKCPSCGSEQIDVFLSGLWDGKDSAGRGTGGTHAVGTCKSCGVHCEQRSVWDNDTEQSNYHTRVLTDAEWQQETAFSMRLHKQQAEWPFVSGGQNHVA